jgi:hypothetical protein
MLIEAEIVQILPRVEAGVVPIREGWFDSI